MMLLLLLLGSARAQSSSMTLTGGYYTDAQCTVPATDPSWCKTMDCTIGNFLAVGFAMGVEAGTTTQCQPLANNCGFELTADIVTGFEPMFCAYTECIEVWAGVYEGYTAADCTGVTPIAWGSGSGIGDIPYDVVITPLDSSLDTEDVTYEEFPTEADCKAGTNAQLSETYQNLAMDGCSAFDVSSLGITEEHGSFATTCAADGTETFTMKHHDTADCTGQCTDEDTGAAIACEEETIDKGVCTEVVGEGYWMKFEWTGTVCSSAPARIVAGTLLVALFAILA